MSISFYIISIGTIKSYVIPQIDKSLTAAAQDAYKNLNATSAQQTLNKNEQARTNVEFYLEDKRKKTGCGYYLPHQSEGWPGHCPDRRSWRQAQTG
ncbi:hypothetical protein ACFSQ7_42300 [Paenibacillus rhizoplanae]